MAAEPTDVRMARLEGGYQQTDRRLSEMQVDIRELRGHLDHGFSGLRREVRQQFYWLLGILVVGILVPLHLRLLSP